MACPKDEWPRPLEAIVNGVEREFENFINLEMSLEEDGAKTAEEFL
jgi:hypothetical protein